MPHIRNIFTYKTTKKPESGFRIYEDTTYIFYNLHIYFLIIEKFTEI